MIRKMKEEDLQQCGVIYAKGHLGLTSVEYKADVEPRKQEIIDFCKNI